MTGPSVQDFYGRVKLLPDGCSYSLLSLPAHSVFQVVGHFRERGRLGVNFLDSVTLVQPSISDVHVDHNGLVYVSWPPWGRRRGSPDVDLTTETLLCAPTQLDSEVTTASSESQTIGRVQFSRGEDGVLAVMDVTTHTISVLFNGESVQLRLEGTWGRRCGTVWEKDLLEKRAGEERNVHHFLEAAVITVIPLTWRVSTVMTATFRTRAMFSDSRIIPGSGSGSGSGYRVAVVPRSPWWNGLTFSPEPPLSR